MSKKRLGAYLTTALALALLAWPVAAQQGGAGHDAHSAHQAAAPTAPAASDAQASPGQGHQAHSAAGDGSGQAAGGHEGHSGGKMGMKMGMMKGDDKDSGDKGGMSCKKMEGMEAKMKGMEAKMEGMGRGGAPMGGAGAMLGNPFMGMMLNHMADAQKGILPVPPMHTGMGRAMMKMHGLAGLNLTPEQKAKVRDLAYQGMKGMTSLAAQEAQLRLDINYLLGADTPDKAKVKEAYGKLGQVEADIILAQQSYMQSLKALLTPDQLTQLDN